MCSPADDSMLVIALTGCVAAPLIGARVFISASDRALAKSGVAAPDAPRLFRWCGYGFAIAIYWWLTLAFVIPWDRLKYQRKPCSSCTSSASSPR